MGDVLACRVCLASKDLKLCSFFNYNLAQAYEILTGNKVLIGDGMPFYICTYCSALLIKSASFKQKCINSETLLRYILAEQNELSVEFIRSLDREVHGLGLPYSLSGVLPMRSYLDSRMLIKHEIESDVPVPTDFVDVKSEEEHCLPPVAERPKRARRKRKPKDKRRECDVAVKSEFDFDGDGAGKGSDDSVLSAPRSPPSPAADRLEDVHDVEVVTLTRKQQFEEVEARRRSWNYTNSAFKCDKCYKGFMLSTTYANHMERHDPKRGPYECEVCFSRWPEPRALRIHINNAHSRKYVCKLCYFVSRSRYRAREHFQMHNGHKFVCKTCGATFSKSTSHLTHIRLHHPSNYSCDICGESFIGEFGLSMHKRRTHREQEFQCQCSAEFQNLEALKRHLDSSINGQCDPEARPCGQCGEGLPSDEDLRAHVQIHRPQTTRLKCEQCDRSFANERSLAVHTQRVHLGVKLKQTRPSARRPAARVVCEVCGKTCTTNATLQYHRRIHTGEKPFQCGQCPKRFTVLQRLQIHVRTHTGESPYKCQRCPKAFKHKAALNRHDRVHTGVKPYVCSHCGKAFSQSNSMKLHVNTVHLKMPAPYRSSRRNKT